MNSHRSSLLIALCMSIGFLDGGANAQDVSTLWFLVRNDFAVNDSALMIFANSSGASYGIDSLSPLYYEYEPPPPPPGMQVSFGAFRGAATFGGYPMDLRGIPSNPTRRDTFDILLDHTETGGQFANYRFYWPDEWFIHEHCDSMFLIPRTAGLTDLGGNPIPNSLDMTTTNTMSLQMPMQVSGPFKFRIIKYGVKFVEHLSDPFIFYDNRYFLAVRDDRAPIPPSFRLNQNYPNPFNPSTTIPFDIPKKSFVNISVFNLLGQEVARLASEELLAGSYATKWNGKTQHGQLAGSGVYFVRMSAVTVDPNRDVYSSVRKIVLSR